MHYAVLSWAALAVQLLLLGTVTWLLQRQIRRRLAAEQEYLRANGRASSVLQTVREPIVLLDASQRIVLHNPAFADLYGLEERGNELMALEDVGGASGAMRRSTSVWRTCCCVDASCGITNTSSAPPTACCAPC